MKVISRNIGLVDYEVCWDQMRRQVDSVHSECLDEFWTLEHPSVYTLGKSAKMSSVPFSARSIRVVRSDRGGQVTYHGKGQLVLYIILNVRRLGFGPKELVLMLEKGVIDYLETFGISAYGRRDFPGVYVDNKKVASIGLRISNGFSYHGLAVNVDMDLEPFRVINPCGIEGMEVTQLLDLGINSSLGMVSCELRKSLYASIYRDKSIKEIEARGFRKE